MTDVDAPARRTGVVLAIACATQFVCVLDASIVTVALPPMRDSLGLSATELQWVVNGYTLTFAGFLLLGGRIADVWGRRRAFVTGLVVFSLASLAGGFAQEGWQLIAARAVQGVGGAVLVPTALTLVTTGFADPAARARALSLLTAAAAAGGTLGGVIGGLLTELLSWRWVLFVNVPLGALLVAAALWSLVGRSGRSEPGRLDLLGSTSVTLATAALVGAVVLGEDRGWAAPSTLACVGLAVIGFVVFLFAERRAVDPVVPLSVFRVRPVVVANGLAALTGGVLLATMFFLALHLQEVLGLDPLAAGLALTPGPVGIALGSVLASRCVGVLGPRTTFVAGSLVTLVGLVWLSRLDPGGSAWGIVAPLALAMAGLGVSGLPLTLTATSGLGPERSGLASGLLSTSKQVGAALGLAALVAVASAATPSPGLAAELARGFGAALLAAAGLLLLAAVGGLALPGRPSTLPSRTDATR